MRITGRIRAFLGGVPRASVRRDARRYLAAAADCRAAQAGALRRLIDLNAGSRFSAAHRLHEVHTPAELRGRLPIAGFDAFAPWVDELKVGRFDALLGPRNPLLMFSLSSGTTSESKYIPITRPFLDDYRRGWQIWGIHTLDDHSGVNSRVIVQFSGHHDRFRTPGGTPCGSISGLVTAMQKPIVRSMYAIPAAVARIADPDSRHYAALRLAVASPHVGMVTTANPSTLIHLAKLADERRDELIRDIRDGRLSSRCDVPADVRSELSRRIGRRDPRPARCIRATTGPRRRSSRCGPGGARGRTSPRCGGTTATCRSATTASRPAKAA